ncbi:DUF4286 family protein [Endozoicomonas atrinae]|uniref:DUF4286 family protein n=1 Tax=Endozoicomonas atrinae TaxID=1333660 RepID=UPI000824707B|nr:DUF4286 family protein [Endozoicomonas atrinae]
MIIYEVNCLVDNGIVDEFRAWLKPHVEAVLKADGFQSAEVLNLTDDDQLTARPYSTGFSIRYQVSGQSALDHYLLHLAPALRKDGIDTFGDQFTAYRRVLKADA